MPTSYRVCVPSRSRPAIFAERTLRMLLDGGVPAHSIDVWTRVEEKADYEAVVPEGVHVRAEIVGDGLHITRNVIARSYAIGTRIVEFDDDVKKLVRRVDSKTLERVKDVHGLIEDTFTEADKVGAGLWGLYPVKNPFFMRAGYRTGLAFLDGTAFGYTITWDDAELVSAEAKEDTERTLRFYLRDGLVLRVEEVSFDADYLHLPGGCQDTRTIEAQWEHAQQLVASYPDFCSLRISKSRGTPEVKLRNLGPRA